MSSILEFCNNVGLSGVEVDVPRGLLHVKQSPTEKRTFVLIRGKVSDKDVSTIRERVCRGQAVCVIAEDLSNTQIKSFSTWTHLCEKGKLVQESKEILSLMGVEIGDGESEGEGLSS